MSMPEGGIDFGDVNPASNEVIFGFGDNNDNNTKNVELTFDGNDDNNNDTQNAKDAFIKQNESWFSKDNNKSATNFDINADSTNNDNNDFGTFNLGDDSNNMTFDDLTKNDGETIGFQGNDDIAGFTKIDFNFTDNNNDNIGAEFSSFNVDNNETNNNNNDSNTNGFDNDEDAKNAPVKETFKAIATHLTETDVQTGTENEELIGTFKIKKLYTWHKDVTGVDAW
eukprot:CAMPEP_0114656566 /NCGR_PEP_ID=MMETSP0191-20121206/12560_1 /TAXON_ID=126664 /ORGANISM="Sorites sp." /LENGTH=224 /DNA_ID=CAMNT_0001874085 /DNA_START=1038 /DNA_END=1709 /DNA_ORIENTATION=-